MIPVWEPLPEGLLSDVLNYLDITWEDEATERKIAEFIYSGMQYLNDKAGAPIDFSWPGPGRTLLFDYVRYARDGAMDVFENNYRHLLLAMQNDRKVSDDASEPVPPGD